MTTKRDERTGVRADPNGSAEAAPVHGGSAFRRLDPRVPELQQRAEALEQILRDLDSNLNDGFGEDATHAKRNVVTRSILTLLTHLLLGGMMFFAHGSPGFIWLLPLFVLYSGLSLYSFVNGYKMPIYSSDSTKQRRILRSESAYYAASFLLMAFIFGWYFMYGLLARHEFITATGFSLSHATLTNWQRLSWARKALKIGKQRKAAEEELTAVKRELGILLGHSQTESPSDPATVDLDTLSAKHPQRGRR